VAPRLLDDLKSYGRVSRSERVAEIYTKHDHAIREELQDAGNGWITRLDSNTILECLARAIIAMDVILHRGSGNIMCWRPLYTCKPREERYEILWRFIDYLHERTNSNGKLTLFVPTRKSNRRGSSYYRWQSGEHEGAKLLALLMEFRENE